MAAEGKVELKAKLDVSSLEEMNSKERKELEKHKLFSKEIKKITFEEKVELDPRKWKQKTLDEGVYGAVRLLFKQFGVRIGELMREGGWENSPKFIKTFQKEQKDLQKEVTDVLSLAVEELAKGTGETKKMIADIKKQLVELDDVDSDLVFGAPREKVVSVYDVLAKEFAASGKKDKEFDKAMAEGAFAKQLSKALEGLSDANYTFLKNGKAAQAAIDATLKMASNVKKDKEATPELVSFGAEVLKKERDFMKFVDDTKTFEGELNGALAEIKGAKMKAEDALGRKKKFSSMNGLDKSADAVIKLAKSWKTELAKIAKDVK